MKLESLIGALWWTTVVTMTTIVITAAPVSGWQPLHWLQSESEQVARKRIKNEVLIGVETVIGDRLPIRVLGNLLSSVVSVVLPVEMGELMANQTLNVAEILAEAKSYLEADASVGEVMGSNLQLGRPSSYGRSGVRDRRGKIEQELRLLFPVKGSLGSCDAKLTATDWRIKSLELEIENRTINVALNVAK